jgi:hypothetical protein
MDVIDMAIEMSDCAEASGAVWAFFRAVMITHVGTRDVTVRNILEKGG